VKLLPQKKYNLIYADPPWTYSDKRDHASIGAAKSAYETMTLQDICDLPVHSIAADNCMLALWATWPKIEDAMAVIRAWKFQYVTCAFVWVKLRPNAPIHTFTRHDIYSGLGYYTNGNTEFVLLGRKGERPIRNAGDVKQVIFAPRQEHSRKPYEVRSELVRLFGDVPRIELFHRGAKPHSWDTWGLESGE
jgi:N6-adenosine-specific RNA methylase IME4